MTTTLSKRCLTVGILRKAFSHKVTCTLPNRVLPLRKIPKFHLISSRGSFLESHSFVKTNCRKLLVNSRSIPLHEKGLYLEFLWSVVSANVVKYGPEKLRIRTPFTQCTFSELTMQSLSK